MEPRFIDDRILGIKRRYFYPGLIALAVIVSSALGLLLFSGPDTASGPAETVTRFEQPGSSEREVQAGQRAPKIDLPVLAGSGTLDLSAGPAVIEFFASWCPHCQNMAPIVDRALAKVPANFILVGAARESDQQVIEFHQRFLNQPMPGIAVNDRQLTITKQYGVSGYPTLVFVDGQGRISATLTGEHPEKVVVAELNKIAGS